MKKDIDIPVFEDVWIAAVATKNDFNETEWDIYLINNKSEKIENVLVTSRGYGSLENKKRKTAVFRHSLGSVGAKSFKKIEPISEEVFGLNNEYLLTFFIGKNLFDKKYIFLAETIKEEHLIDLPIVNKKGVLIK